MTWLAPKYRVCPKCSALYDAQSWFMRFLEWVGRSRWIYSVCLTCRVKLRPATPEELAEFEKYS